MKPYSESLLNHLLAVSSVLAVTLLLVSLRTHINSTSVGLIMVLVILFVAIFAGSISAFLASIAAMLCFNYFFLPPIGALTIADPQNWVALFVFLVVALTVGQLSARVKRRAREAEASKREIERLYEELRDAFEQASQTEALRRSEKLKSALLDAVTHDIRTPLTSIKASVTTLISELRREISLDERSKYEMLLVIDEECNRLNNYTEKLIELARIEAGDLRLYRRWTALDEIINTAVENSRQILINHKLNVKLSEELPAVLVDSHAIAEVIYLLIDNAVKYSPEQSLIMITASAINDAVEIMVEDEGIGIPVEFREKVFDKFFRVNERGARKGVGMGLAIAKSLVEAHGGSIRIEDTEKRKGTRFVIRLPIGDN